MEQEYKYFLDVKGFVEVSGLSKDDFEKKVASNQEFKKFIRKFEDSRKRYIKVKPALEFIENNLMSSETDLWGGENMSDKDKTILIAGMMFNVTFFLSMMLNIFITNSVAVAMVASVVTYLFFDKLFYAQKKTESRCND